MVAKLDPLVAAALDRAKTDGLPLQVQLIGAVGVTIFVATVVLTFTSRKYWR